ncbi:MAG: hypothetical protein K6E54_02960 [Bacteroidaceae bacterium]|nr:hypothetical protein [Bacteroidaceae bacterium]
MKPLNFILIFATMVVCNPVVAQDWQIGGGSDETPTGSDNTSTYDPYYRSEDESDYYYEKSTPAKSNFVLSGGYVNKEWVTDFGNHTIHENFWGERNKRLHGMQLGFSYQPVWKMGIGLQTGVYYEAYISESDYVDDRGYDDFVEHCFYIPVHAMFRVPLMDDNISLAVFGGLGFNYAVTGVFYDNYDYYDDYYDEWHRDSYTEYQEYGNDKWPRRFNLQAELGAKLRIKSVEMSFTYSRGLNNHNLYDGHKTRQDKLAISVGWVIPEF